MIHYDLICSRNHAFDGWFRDSTTFEKQAQAGQVACPHCSDVQVNRALMAPAIGRRREPAAPPPSTPQEPIAPAPVAAKQLPDVLRAQLQRLRSEIEQRCEHVGDRFAEEARAIHRGERDARSIYGDATPEQAESLAEEGIEISSIPWIARADG